jgi:hypothetical protein
VPTMKRILVVVEDVLLVKLFFVDGHLVLGAVYVQNAGPLGRWSFFQSTAEG